MIRRFDPANAAIGIDLGGTKIEAIVLDGRRDVQAGNGKDHGDSDSDDDATDFPGVAATAPPWRERVATPTGDYPATLAAIALLVRRAEAELGLVGATVGIGMPGSLDGDGIAKNANSTCLNGRPLRRDLEAALARPVRLANDADCLALSEATDGAGAGEPTVFAAILGTGVGAGIVVRGRALSGPNGLAGEWGHNPLPWPTADELPGPACYCGRQGCLETWLSGPALARDHARHAGTLLAPSAIVARAAAGDLAAEASWQRYESRLARGLASVVNLLDPQVIVLGGGLSNLDRLLTNVPRLWGRHVFGASDARPVRTRLTRARHGDSSGVRGAAWLWRLP